MNVKSLCVCGCLRSQHHNGTGACGSTGTTQKYNSKMAHGVDIRGWKCKCLDFRQSIVQPPGVELPAPAPEPDLCAKCGAFFGRAFPTECSDCGAKVEPAPDPPSPAAPPKHERKPAKSSRERFEQFHATNPDIYQLFKKFTFQAIEAGRERFSGRTIAERIRWYTQVETGDPTGFKLNDHWAPYYVRLFIDEFPEHADFFETRTAIADDDTEDG